MRHYIDTEFIEYPRTIDIISIGIVADDGREFYAESSEFDEKMACSWVRQNVIAKLGQRSARIRRQDIARGIRTFVAESGEEPEFWGYYADYDWVVLCWLFGRMQDLPKGWPRHCKDLKQYIDYFEIKKDDLPSQSIMDAHNALSDARWICEAHRAAKRLALFRAGTKS